MRKSFFIAITTILLLQMSTNMQAQEHHFGFKVGLNRGKTYGPAEKDASGAKLEKFSSVTGIHVGPTWRFMFNDVFGIGSEIMFSQHGGRYKYEGDSWQSFVNPLDSTTNIFATGKRKYIVNSNNAYITVPLKAHIFIGKQFDINFGVNAGFLVSSRGRGETTFWGNTLTGNPIDTFTQIIDFNYVEDGVGEANMDQLFDLMVDGETVQIPGTYGAYYEYPAKDGMYFNRIRMAAQLGVTYRMHNGLSLGITGMHSFLDLTNNYYDYSRYESTGAPDFQRLKRTDTDLDFSIMFSLGLSFNAKQ